MSHATKSGDVPTVFLDIDLNARRELQELASIVNLGLIYRGSLTKTRGALRAAGIYELFGDLMLAADASEIPRILRLLGPRHRREHFLSVDISCVASLGDH